ncbi:MAG: DUF6129 family protein [Thiotrichaceae bacterium]
MMIAEDIVEQIAKFVEQHSVNEATLVELRQTYPSIHFTYCSEDDIHGARPVVEKSKFNIYLVDTRGHCFTLTKDFDNATGVVIAEVVTERA